MKNLDGKIKVSDLVRPLKRKERNIVPLTVGGMYFVSFGSNEVYPCKLSHYNLDLKYGDISVEVPSKPLSKKGFRDLNGEISHSWSQSFGLFADEIGRTPEEAVKNQVTF